MFSVKIQIFIKENMIALYADDILTQVMNPVVSIPWDNDYI